LHKYGDARSAKSFEVLPLIFITDCCLVDWLPAVLKIRSFEEKFFLFLISSTRHVLGGGWILCSTLPPHVLYSGTNSTSEVPVSGFGGWFLGGGSLNFGLIFYKKKKKKTA
jgi:hypothetical protein